MRRIISVAKRGSRLRLLALSVLAVTMLFGATGCYEKLNGGGWMQSANGVDRAIFGLHYDGTTGTAKGTYHDKGAGVRLKFDAASPSFPGFDPNSNCAGFFANYESQDKANPGTGTAFLLACDNGEPGFEGDTLTINVQSGPYAGYTNSGPILGGNLQGLERTQQDPGL